MIGLPERGKPGTWKPLQADDVLIRKGESQ